MSQSWDGIEDAIARTFRVKTCIDSATAFVIERGNRQFLITAGHLMRDAVREVMQGETVRITREGHSDEELVRVRNIAIKTLDDQGQGVDVAVLETEDRIHIDNNELPTGHREELTPIQPVVMVSADLWERGMGIVARRGAVVKTVATPNGLTGDLLVNVHAFRGFSGSPVLCMNSNGRLAIVGIAARWSSAYFNFGEGGTIPVLTEMVGCYHVKHAVDLMRGM